VGKVTTSTHDAVIIGGGIAGLTAAALLSHAGARVAVLEQHTIAGGCASFYQRKRYRFDVGATLVGGFGKRGVHTSIFRTLGVPIEADRIEPAMVVHLPDSTVVRYGDERWTAERLRVFGKQAEPFWNAQERYADAAWDFSSHLPALPVDRASLLADIRALRPWHAKLAGTIGKRVADLYQHDPDRRLRTFVDAQLIITAQAAAEDVDLAYGCTALDLAREGTFHVPGGVGAIATALARSTRRAGSDVFYAARAHRIDARDETVHAVELADGRTLRTACVISALPIFDTIDLCDALQGTRIARRAAAFPQRWGAFTVYCGVPAGAIPDALALHHQLVADDAIRLGETNSTFISLSAPAELGRAPAGGRAITISTHTDAALWERAVRDGSYASLRTEYERALLAALERVAPGAAQRADVIENATPLTFAHYTGRRRGLVGGLPQTPAFANLRALSHRTPVRGLFLCGDTTFPGQSSVGASLSGSAAARAALAHLGGRRRAR
jgi:C-3',4' desaturase CrtD